MFTPKVNMLGRRWFFRLSITMLLFCCQVAFGQQKAASLPDHLPQRTALEEELLQARKAGDEARVQALYAELRAAQPKTPANENLQMAPERPSTTRAIYAKPRERGRNGSEVWGDDVRFRENSSVRNESYPALATASDGTIYGACQFAENDVISLFKSTDNGSSWIHVLDLDNTLPLHSPSIAIGEGVEDKIILAYVIDESPYRRIETTTILRDSEQVEYSRIPGQSTITDYQEPVVWTDSYAVVSYNIYVTAQGNVGGTTTDDVDGAFWYSTDRGATYSNLQIIFGSLNDDVFLDPDGTYGASGDIVYCVAYNSTDGLLRISYSTNAGVSFTTDVFAATLSGLLPAVEVDPDIEASSDQGLGNLMIAVTMGSQINGDNIGTCYSENFGVDWSNVQYMAGATSGNERKVELHANQNGGNWHLTYTISGDVYYSYRPQDLSSFWSTPELVNEENDASGALLKKGITSNWTTDEAVIAWTDLRDGNSDYDIFTDSNIQGGLVGPVEYNASVIDDDNAGQSSGNNDGYLNAGETIELRIQLINTGTDTARGVSVTLAELSNYVNGFIGSDTRAFGKIAPGATAANPVPFRFTIDANTPAGEIIDFDMTVNSTNGGPWGPTRFSPRVIGQGACSGAVNASLFGAGYVGEDANVVVGVLIDMRNADPADSLLGSFTATVDYDPAVLEYRTGSLNLDFTGTLNDSAGRVTFNGANVNGSSDLTAVASLTFKAVGNPGDVVDLDLEFSAMASALNFNSLLACLNPPVDKTIEITDACRKGDVNGDGLCNSTDALILLSYDAGISVSDPTILDNINAACGDINGDGLTNSTDALVLLSYDAGLAVPYTVCN